MFPKRKLLRKRYYKLAVTLRARHCERSEAIPELTLSCWGKKVRLLRRRIYDLAVTRQGSLRGPLFCHCEERSDEAAPLFCHCERSEAVSRPQKARPLRKRKYDLAATKKSAKRRPCGDEEKGRNCSFAVEERNGGLALAGGTRGRQPMVTGSGVQGTGNPKEALYSIMGLWERWKFGSPFMLGRSFRNGIYPWN